MSVLTDLILLEARSTRRPWLPPGPLEVSLEPSPPHHSLMDFPNDNWVLAKQDAALIATLRDLAPELLALWATANCLKDEGTLQPELRAVLQALNGVANTTRTRVL